VRVPIKPAAGSPASQRGCLWGFALFWNAIVIPFAISAIASGNYGMLACLSLHIAVGIGLLCYLIGPILRGVKMAPAEVSVSSDTVRIGEAFTFSFLQEMKQPVNVTGFHIDFVLRESATYRQGTDTRTDTHEVPVRRQEFPPRRCEAGQRIMEEVELEIPRTAMHSFASPNNKVQWLVKVSLEVEKWPDFKEEYEIRVLPERTGGDGAEGA
jgi:hypothetical protein